MNQVFDELKAVAPRLNKLALDSAARVFYELMSGALIWSDERPPIDERKPEEFWCMRYVWRFRSTLILGQPEEKYRASWEEAQRLFPNWPGFLPERQDTKWRQFLIEREENAAQQWEDLDRRFRESERKRQQAEKQPAI